MQAIEQICYQILRACFFRGRAFDPWRSKLFPFFKLRISKNLLNVKIVIHINRSSRKVRWRCILRQHLRISSEHVDSRHKEAIGQQKFYKIFKSQTCILWSGQLIPACDPISPVPSPVSVFCVFTVDYIEIHPISFSQSTGCLLCLQEFWRGMNAAVPGRFLCCSLPSTVCSLILAWIPSWATVPQGCPCAGVNPSWASSRMGDPAPVWSLKCYGGYFLLFAISIFPAVFLNVILGLTSPRRSRPLQTSISYKKC